MARDESGRVGVLPLTKCVCFPRIRKLLRVRLRVAVKGPGIGVVPGNVRVEGRWGALGWGGRTGFWPDLSRWGRGACASTSRENRRRS